MIKTTSQLTAPRFRMFAISRFQKSLRICGVYLGTAIILSGCAVAASSSGRESIIGGFDISEWTVGYDSANQNRMVTEFVLPGETVDNWSELFTNHTIRKSTVSEPIDIFVRAIHEEMSKRCPTIEWNVISNQLPTDTEEASILYEWKLENCPPDADQHEVARVIYGKFNIFRLAYTAKTQALSPERREKWIKALNEAEIVNW